MIPIAHLLAFAGTVVVIVVTPGPAVLFTVGRALTVGRRATLATVPGNAAGVFVQAVAVAFGMGTVVQASALAYSTVKYIGAAYIVYLGVKAIRDRHSRLQPLAGQDVAARPLAAARDGFIVGVTNPKTIIFLVTVMPGFAVPAVGHVRLQLLILGTLFPVATLVFNSGWAFLAGTAREWFVRSPGGMDTVERAGGLALICLGLNLAVTGRSD